jgi:hypothetical protein
VRSLPCLSVSSCNLAYPRMPHSNLGTAASNVEAERSTGFPTVRTQTIEFAPYPRLRHRTSRDISHLGRHTPDMSARDPTTTVSATEYDTRMLFTVFSSGLTDANYGIPCRSPYRSPVSIRIYANISKYSTSQNAC